MDDVLLAKAANIERCVNRALEKYNGSSVSLASDFDVQDIVVLNVQRACEAAIDAAMHIVRVQRLGLPKDKADAFRLLKDAKVMAPELAASMEKMVAFRNVVVHAYTDINIDILEGVLKYGTVDLKKWASLLIAMA